MTTDLPAKLLVTGATSQTGSLAVRALKEAGFDLCCLVRTAANRRFLPPSGIEVFEANLEKPETLRPAFAGIDAVVHIAHIRYASSILDLCEVAGINRAIFFSSTRLFTQFDCLTARQVREGEEAIQAGAIDYTILRPSMIYGSRRDNNISRLIRYLSRHRFFPLIGGGANRVQPVFTLDVANAVVRALREPTAIRSTYTLAGPRPLTYREMIETIAAGLRRPVSFVRVPVRPMLWAARLYETIVPRPRVTSEMIRRFGEDKAFDIADAQRDLDFAPVEFREGLRRQLAGEIDALWAQPPPQTRSSH